VRPSVPRRIALRSSSWHADAVKPGHVWAASADIRALMSREAERANLDDEAAMALAVNEIRAVRTARGSAVTP